jgi:hypothetical protein
LVITGAISATNVIRVYEIDGLIPAGNEIGRPMYDYDAFIRELKNATDKRKRPNGDVASFC